MPELNFEITLEKATMRRIEALDHFPGMLDTVMTVAMLDSVELLQEDAWRFMWDTFKNPTGPLEESLTYAVDSPYQAWMGTDMPYGRRRNWGFSGRTDALGRYYPYDPGIFWVEATISHDEGKITRIFRNGVLEVTRQIEAGYP